MIKKLFLSAKRRVISLWTKLSEERREKLINSLSSSLNYLFNAVLLAIPLSIIISNSLSWKHYLITLVCVWILMPFVEDYYVWFREKWKDDLPK